MRRFAVVPVLLMVAVAATACPAEAPPGSSPPIVSSIVADSPVVAGDAFTITVSAVDNIAVTGIALSFNSPADIEPDPAEVAAMVSCDEPTIAPASAVTVVFHCTTATHALTGTWVVTATVGDAEGSTGYERTGATGFNVVAG